MSALSPSSCTTESGRATAKSHCPQPSLPPWSRLSPTLNPPFKPPRNSSPAINGLKAIKPAATASTRCFPGPMNGEHQPPEQPACPPTLFPLPLGLSTAVAELLPCHHFIAVVNPSSAPPHHPLPLRPPPVNSRAPRRPTRLAPVTRRHVKVCATSWSTRSGLDSWDFSLQNNSGKIVI
jgi:hypothetical protein